MGALGAKVTGGGHGGYMNALTPGRELQEKVTSAMEKEGYKAIRATIGLPGWLMLAFNWGPNMLGCLVTS
jgi:mevalonate kinase